VLFYRAAVDLSRVTLNYLAGLTRLHREAIGTARMGRIGVFPAWPVRGRVITLE
jgi:hypothetical protein